MKIEGKKCNALCKNREKYIVEISENWTITWKQTEKIVENQMKIGRKCVRSVKKLITNQEKLLKNR